MNRRSTALIVLVAIAAAPAAAKPKPKDVLLHDDFPPIGEQHRTMTEVPGAAGAPAVVLLEAEQNEWEGTTFQRTTYLRRVKILTVDGIEEYGDLDYRLTGGWRIKLIRARTVLPDGTVVDADDNVHREKSDTGFQIVRVTFPQVRVGSILDFQIQLTSDYWGVDPWVIQERIPVLESRFVMIPARGLRYRPVPVWIPPDRAEPEEVQVRPGVKGYVWVFENVEALPDEPNLPPTDDISQRLFVILDSYRDDVQYFPIAPDWKTWCSARKEAWDKWLKKSHDQTASLAARVTEGKEGAPDRAEAIRLALRDRVRVDYLSIYAVRESPDEVLAEGSGTSADLAGLTVAMLRAAGVDAGLAAVRRRSSGMVPEEFPAPSLFDDLVVRLPSEGDLLVFSPALDVPVGVVPYDCSGVLAAPFEDDVERPVVIPDFRASENRAIRSASVALSPDGTVRGESTHTYRGPAAERWRRALTGQDDDARRHKVQLELRAWMPSLRLAGLEVKHLDDGSEDLVLKCDWVAEGYATAAGGRLVVTPTLFQRVPLEAWAAGGRRFPIDLGSAYETFDTVVVKLPDETEDATLPGDARLDAGAVGLYELSFESRRDTVVVKRHMRLDHYRFPSQSFDGLKKWFTDIAEADARPVVVKLP